MPRPNHLPGDLPVDRLIRVEQRSSTQSKEVEKVSGQRGEHGYLPRRNRQLLRRHKRETGIREG